ncbi:MAG: hypothetical protein IJK90_06295 [Bacteroidales bacterium]|nr:hypothetical protein [Bacteroidales bacterium]
MVRQKTEIDIRLEREAMTIAAHALQRENAELRRKLLNTQQELIIVEAEMNRLLQVSSAGLSHHKRIWICHGKKEQEKQVGE